MQATSFNQPLRLWNVENVTDMNSMFYLANSFNQPLDWDVKNVTNMGGCLPTQNHLINILVNGMLAM